MTQDTQALSMAVLGTLLRTIGALANDRRLAAVHCVQRWVVKAKKAGQHRLVCIP